MFEYIYDDDDVSCHMPRGSEENLFSDKPETYQYFFPVGALNTWQSFRYLMKLKNNSIKFGRREGMVIEKHATHISINMI